MNKVTFIIERTFDVEYPNRKFGILIDLTADSKTGKPGIASYTFKGGELIHNVITGVGGLNGLSSGPVASPVAGTKLVNFGYAGVAVFNPYRSVILISNEVENAIY